MKPPYLTTLIPTFSDNISWVIIHPSWYGLEALGLGEKNKLNDNNKWSLTEATYIINSYLGLGQSGSI
jgi:hypothetical protein